MLTIFTNRKVVNGPWGGGNHWNKAVETYMPKHGHSLNVPASSGDVCWLFSGWDAGDDHPPASAIVEATSWTKHRPKYILRVNDCDARKNTKNVDDELLRLSERIDGTIFVSQYMQDYFMTKGWACATNTVIINGVDTDVFKPTKRSKGKVTSIVAHSWSDNPMKGLDTFEFLSQLASNDPAFQFTFIGRHKGKLTGARHIPPLHGHQLGRALADHDVYISASQFEPGPNHVLEALACNLPTYVPSTGGASIEFAGDDHVYKDHKQLVSMLLSPKQNNDAVKVKDWKETMSELNEFIKVVMG